MNTHITAMENDMEQSNITNHLIPTSVRALQLATNGINAIIDALSEGKVAEEEQRPAVEVTEAYNELYIFNAKQQEHQDMLEQREKERKRT